MFCAKPVHRFFIISLMAFMLILFQSTDVASAKETGEAVKRPARLITMAVEYPGVKIAKGEEQVSMDIIFHNKGKSDENVSIRVDAMPDGWNARIKTYRYSVTGVHVPSGKDKSLTFEADLPKDVTPGDYQFRISASTLDGRFKMSQPFTISVLAH